MTDLQKEFDRLKEKLMRSSVLKEQAMKQLKNEFGCASLEEAEAKLLEMEESISEQEKQLKLRLRRFREQYQLAVDGESDGYDED